MENKPQTRTLVISKAECLSIIALIDKQTGKKKGNNHNNAFIQGEVGESCFHIASDLINQCVTAHSKTFFDEA
jgi:hypothetical protein